ncbi:MAG: NUDIX hydrolase [Gammaproteobacteria bacterium]|nr:NUDIX hydrolase [Gammaproteobacteria bacterium]MDH5303980.1 NUDIX hydrolase [Gammaproteobacteria bacterium]MDH5321741.1 NUDIX hydrolase [Gammaproteobacteria bacterium]
MQAEEAAPRPSSTVVLVRAGDPRPEVFMVKRHAGSSFGSRFAFPGGVLEASDALVHDAGSGLSVQQAGRLLQLDRGALDYYSAAIRELFEESGVLLAAHGLSATELQESRAALNEGSLRWDRFVRARRLQLHYDRLHYFSFWITPPGIAKRYSTRFFLAELPAAQDASHDGCELVESCWMPAADILAARKLRQMQLPYPTRKTLKRVAVFDGTTDLLNWARACGDKGVVCNRPAFKPEMLR